MSGPPLPIARYDALLIYCLVLTFGFWAVRLETWREIAVVFGFHLIGLALELFKVRLGSWQYPGDAVTKFAGVPLFAGLPSKEQAQHLVEQHLLNPKEYAPDGDVQHWVTTTAKTEPTWEARRYWRGPVWIIMNWFIIDGLKRYGYDDLAELIRKDTLGLIEAGGFREYYDARDGSGCGSTDFSWSAALALELTSDFKSDPKSRP